MSLLILSCACAPALAAPSRLALGVDISGGLYELAPIAAFEGVAGERVDRVQDFVAWDYTAEASWADFPSAHVDAVLARGSTPEITWDPTIYGAHAGAQISFAAIAAGDYDAYAERFAAAAARAPGTIVLRFAHEVNGSWLTYSAGHPGDDPASFVRAWRHLHALFTRAGASNVRWMFSPNVSPAGGKSLRPLYPGDAYVDYVGIDGYSYPATGCPSPSRLFGGTLADIGSFSDRPILLSEVAVSAHCPGKPRWITDLFGWLAEHPRVVGLTWWERSEPANDWRVQSSPAAALAFRRGLVDYDRGTL